MKPIIIPEDIFELEKFKSRFISKIQKTKNCWIWQASKDNTGYGRFVIKNEPNLAHRVSYTLFIGSIPNGLTLDHLCRNHSCVNPFHLEAVSMKENMMRGIGKGAQNARKTHCINGHEFTPENTYKRNKGSRGCKTCKKLRAEQYLLKKQRTPVNKGNN